MWITKLDTKEDRENEMKKEKEVELEIEELLENETWKRKNKKYLWELQKFLDLSDNIQEEEIRKIVISQMLKCDKTLKKIAEDIFKKIQEENA